MPFTLGSDMYWCSKPVCCLPFTSLSPQAPSFYWEIEIVSYGDSEEDSGPIVSFGFATEAEKRDGAWTNPVGTCLFHKYVQPYINSGRLFSHCSVSDLSADCLLSLLYHSSVHLSPVCLCVSVMVGQCIIMAPVCCSGRVSGWM